MTSSLSNKHANGTMWIGDEGWVFVSRGQFRASNPKWTDKSFDRGPIRAYESNEHERNFLDCIKSRKPCICPAETGHRSITPGHLGLVSEALGGRIIRWDPAGQQVINDSEAEALLAFNPRQPWKL